MIELSNRHLHLCLCEPGGFYRGTRFDWSGVFRNIVFEGIEFSGLWFDGIDPLRHDNLTGCSEEFAPIWIDGIHCVKPGVGLLDVPEGKEGYDRFKLYEIVNSGQRSFSTDGTTAAFLHSLDGFYEYEKKVSITGTNSFEIAHSFVWKAATELECDCYNHNFFTFGKESVGPARRVEFDCEPQGNWRADSVNAYINGKELKFERVMKAGEKSYMGNLRLPRFSSKPYHFRLSEENLSLEVLADVPMDHAVFWSNDRVACVEPYVSLCTHNGGVLDWRIEYRLNKQWKKDTATSCPE